MTVMPRYLALLAAVLLLSVAAPRAAIVFDGTADSMTVPDADIWTFADGVGDLPFSVSALVYMISTHAFRVINKGTIGVSDCSAALRAYQNILIDFASPLPLYF
jgi:hypothetical protein